MQTTSKILVKELRAVLVQRGTSLNAVCKSSGLHRHAVTTALSGTRPGPKSSLLAREFLGRVGAK